MPPSEPQRVLVVEDDSETAALLRLYLEDAGYEVIVAERGDQGLDIALRRRPDVVLLDLMLPGMDGLQVCERLRKQSDVPILMITARTLEEDRLRGFDAGADDYISKPFSPREVVRRVRAVLRRAQGAEQGPLLRVAQLELDPERRTLFVGAREVQLTATEFEILQALMRSPGRVFTRADLIEVAFERDFDGLDRTVDAHMGNLRRKLKAVMNGVVPLETVKGVGYRLVAHEPA